MNGGNSPIRRPASNEELRIEKTLRCESPQPERRSLVREQSAFFSELSIMQFPVTSAESEKFLM